MRNKYYRVLVSTAIFISVLGYVAAQEAEPEAGWTEETTDEMTGWDTPVSGDFDSGTEAAPSVGISLGYRLSAKDGMDTEGDFILSQSVDLGLQARFGANAFLDGALSYDTSRNYVSNPVTPEGIISQLYLTWRPVPVVALSAGKQRLSWGSARVLGSIDRLETLPDPTPGTAKSSLPGTIGLKGDLIATESIGLSFFAAPNRVPEWSSAALRAEALIEGIDAGFGATTFAYDKLEDVSLMTGTATFDRDRRWAVFADAAWFGDLFGFYAEGQAANARSSQWAWFDGTGAVIENTRSSVGDWTFKVTAGTQIDLPVWLNGTARIIAEYRYNGDGLSKAEMEPFVDAEAGTDGTMILAAPEGIGSGGFSANYAYAGISGLPITRKFRVGCGTLVSLDTWFAISSMSLSWDASQSVGVSASWNHARRWYGNVPSEEDFFPWRNSLSVSVSAGF